MLNNGLEFCKAQMKQNALTASNRHVSDTRTGLMDSTVQGRRWWAGLFIPVRGCLSVADAYVRVQIPVGDAYL